MSIRPYQPSLDEAGVFSLWQAAFGLTWPLTRGVFRRVTVDVDVYRDGDHFVAVDHDTPVGFVATQVDRDAPSPRVGHLVVLLVASSYQRQGIGRALHDTALRHLRAEGVCRVQLGGGDSYLWPGVPATLAPALAFFNACGWVYTETSYDLVQDVTHLIAPPSIYRHVADHGIRLAIGTAADAADLLAFEAREFPQWEAAYRSVVALGDCGDILLARDDKGHIIGAVSMYSPVSQPRRMDIRWKTLLGEDAGAIGIVGVAGAARGRGVGHALVARASEIVRERGARQCFIGWAWMIGLYGDLGYRVWQEYRMGRREVP